MGVVSDPIADLLTRMRNASQAQRSFLDVRHSKMKEEIVKLLIQHGFVNHYLYKEENKKGTMRIFLKYSPKREPILQHLERISSPSHRQYVNCKHIPRVFGGMGIAILSTPKGILEGSQARALRVGGELLCLVW